MSHRLAWFRKARQNQKLAERVWGGNEKIRVETWTPGQTLPKLRHAIALILQELKR